MKNKKLTYILIPAVLAIWGLIGWKILDGTSPEELMELPVNIPAPGSDLAIQQDTFELHTGYSDPFLERSLLKRSSSSNVAVEGNPRDRRGAGRVIKKTPTVKVPVVWPEVACLGRHTNKASGKQVVIMKVEGREQLMRQGDILMNMELLSIAADSVVLKYKEETKALAL